MNDDREKSAAPSEELIERARGTRVIVVGGGIGGLVAAWECARIGMEVVVLESREQLGGVVRRAVVGDIELDVGAESYATRGGHVRGLIDDLGLASDVVTPQGGRAWLVGAPVGAAPLPVGGVLGIPANPFDPEVRRVIGWAGAWRAYLDRLRPPLTIGHRHSLGALVATRMGPRVRDRLVAPILQGVYSARPDDIDVDIAAPGLNAALTRTGSLSGAVAVLGAEWGARAPGSAVEGIRGGIVRIVEALRARLDELGATVVTGARVGALRRDAQGWRVEVERESEPETIAADAVIVATDEQVARTLLAPWVPTLADPDGIPDLGAEMPEIEVVSLVVDAPALDVAPRGSGVLTVPGSHRAKALTHATVKWGWLREAVQKDAPHRHVVRVSFGGQGEPAATAGLGDGAAIALALGEASALLGVALTMDDLVAGHRERYTQSQPASIIGRAAQTVRARSEVRAVPGLGVVGAWVSGTGLAQVVPDAAAESERVRAALLWSA